MEISFKATPREKLTIRQLAERARAKEGNVRSLQDWIMDFTAVHANGNPLRLNELLEADNFNFMHDAFGIAACLNRETGQLEKNFRPRYSV